MVGCVQPYICQNTDLCEICLDIHGFNIAKTLYATQPTSNISIQNAISSLYDVITVVKIQVRQVSLSHMQLKCSEKINAILDKR